VNPPKKPGCSDIQLTPPAHLVAGIPHSPPPLNGSFKKNLFKTSSFFFFLFSKKAPSLFLRRNFNLNKQSASLASASHPASQRNAASRRPPPHHGYGESAGNLSFLLLFRGEYGALTSEGLLKAAAMRVLYNPACSRLNAAFD